MTTRIQRFNPDGLFDSSVNHHAQVTVIEPSKLAFFSGQVAWSPEREAAPDSLAEQAIIVMGHLETCLDSVGATQEDIVMMRIYVVDWSPKDYEVLFPALEAFLGDVHPSMTGVGVQALAGPDLKLEVEMIVRVPS